MKLDKVIYKELRSDMRTEMVRLARSNAPVWEVNVLKRRLSRLDMAWARGTEWEDFIPGVSVDTVFHGTSD